MDSKVAFVYDGSLEDVLLEIESNATTAREHVEFLIEENGRLWQKLRKLGTYAAGLRRKVVGTAVRKKP